MISAIALVAASGCATVPMSNPSGDTRWSYKPDSGVGVQDGPMALHGEEGTLAFYIVACDKAGAALEFSDIEVEPFDGKRPIRFKVADVIWSGFEVLDPPDLVAISRSRIPLAHPIVTSIEDGASPIVVKSRGEREYRLPNDPVIGRVVRECRPSG